MRKKKLIAVYGTLRKGNGNHRLLQNAEYLGTFDSKPEYELYHLGGYPGLKENGNTSIKLEIYAVTDEEALRVDALEGYTEGEPAYFYDKKYLETPWGNAGIYIYMGNVSEERRIITGDWMQQKLLQEV